MMRLRREIDKGYGSANSKSRMARLQTQIPANTPFPPICNV